MTSTMAMQAKSTEQKLKTTNKLQANIEDAHDKKLNTEGNKTILCSKI